MSYNTWVVLIGVSLLGAAAGVVGTFAVLRGRALTGDALAHAALPGLCMAVAITGTRDLTIMLLGAFASGLLGVAVLAFLRRYTRVAEDAAVGIVLSVFFGAGVVLASRLQQQGNAAIAGLDSYILGKTAGITLNDIYQIGGLALINLVIVLALFRDFRLICFDPAFAIVQGRSVYWLDLLLMALMAATVVIGLPAVGVVMIAALLILPSAAARWWSDRLGTIVTLAGGFGIVMGTIGTLISDHYRGMPAGPVIVLIGVLIFALSAIVGPQHGWIARQWRQRQAKGATWTANG